MSQREPVSLGPFDLDAPVGRGGMGLVFRGHHREQGVPVAVKVIEHRDGDASRTFRNEIRAMAGLDHPGVIWVFDVGEVPERVERLTGGQIPAGAPFIAMEYASRGTLHDLIGKVGWEDLYDVALELLDALAHAHARGVVHRDLKPGNVLLCGPEDLRPGLKLADFGIAHAVEKTEIFSMSGGSKAIGTLHYMAPEQIRADVADYGPWTDVYALGHLFWHLLGGHVPFKGRSGMALIRAQLDLELPDLVGVRVPAGFMDWLRTCTRKDPAQRFACAADAARALVALGPAEEPSFQIPDTLADTLPTVRLTRSPEGALLVESFGTEPVQATAAIAEEAGTAAITPAPAARVRRGRREDALHTLSLVVPSAAAAQAPSFPGWQRPKTPGRSLQLLGAGLGLFGVRRVPMVGRIDERDQLWRALAAVHGTGRARAVLLTGAAGTGKSRLGSWLCERSHELGLSTPLRSDRWRTAEDGGDPLRQLWERWFRLGKDPSHAEEENRRSWMRVMVGRLGLEGGAERFEPVLGSGDLGTRVALSVELLAGIGRRRPAVVFLDDVGADGLRLVRQALEQQAETMRALFVVVARDEDLSTDDEVRGAVDRLALRDDVEALRVEALAPAYRAALVEEMLGLAPELAAQVVERTEGNPLFASQLIGDWVERDLLELGPAGFRVREGEQVAMPTSVAQVWQDRVRQLLMGVPHRAGSLLERAAVLGLDVNWVEWQQVCDDPDGSRAREGYEHVSDENEAMRQALLERLVGTRLAEPTDEGFRFAHGMLREALVERSSRERRLGSHHRACAAMLGVHPDPDRVSERLGRHLLEGGDLAAAIQPLLRGVERRTNTTGYRSALALLSRAEGALRDLDLPLTDERWAEVWNLRSTLFAELGQLEQAERWALRVLAHGERPGWAEHAVRSRLSLGLIHLSRGEWREADHEFARILELSEDLVATGWAMAYRALLAGRRGDATRRKQYTSEAVRRLRKVANSRAMAACWRVVGSSCLMEGQLAQAEESLQRSLALSRKMGHLFGQAEALSELGEVARHRGRLDDAVELYQQAIHFYELTGSSRAMFPRVHLASVRLRQGRYDDAHALLSVVRLQVGRQGRELAVLALPHLLAAAAAGRGDWREVDHHLQQGEGQRSLDADSRDALEHARDVLQRAGQGERAKRVALLLER